MIAPKSDPYVPVMQQINRGFAALETEHLSVHHMRETPVTRCGRGESGGGF
jgi:hypothetical protein